MGYLLTWDVLSSFIDKICFKDLEVLFEPANEWRHWLFDVVCHDVHSVPWLGGWFFSKGGPSLEECSVCFSSPGSVCLQCQPGKYKRASN